MNRIDNIRKIKPFWVAIALAAATFLVPYLFTSSFNLASTANTLSKQLQEKEQFIHAATKDTAVLRFVRALQEKNTSFIGAASIIERFDKEEVIFQVYTKDSLVFWTDNRVVSDSAINRVPHGTSFAKLANGYYLRVKAYKRGNTLMAYFPVFAAHSINNFYLRGGFNPELDIADYVALSDSQTTHSKTIYAEQQKALFYIAFSDTTYPKIVPFIQNTCWILALIILLFYADAAAQKRINTGEIGEAYGLLTIAIVVIKGIGLYFKLPHSVYDYWELFSPTVFAASFWLPSLGDLIIDCLLGLWIVYFTYRNIKNIPLPVLDKRWYAAIAVLFIVAVNLLADVLSGVFSSLVLNSNISFDVTNVLNFTQYSALGFTMLGVCLYTFFLVCNSLIIYSERFQFTNEEKVYVFTLGLLISFIYKIAIDKLDILLISNVVYLFSLERFRVNKVRIFSMRAIVLALILFSVVSSVKLQEFNKEKDIENRKLLALQLESGNDPVTEFLFADVAEKLSKDSLLITSIAYKLRDNEELNNRLRQYYFGNYFNRYKVSFTRYDVNGENLNKRQQTLKEATAILNELGIVTPTTGLYQVGNTLGIQYYLAKLPIRSGYTTVGTVLVRLQTQELATSNNYPELLLAENLNVDAEISKYDYAYYKNGKLVNRAGEYPYSLDEDFTTKGLGFFTTERGDYTHVVYTPNYTTRIVLSKPVTKLFNSFAIFSYFFGFLSVFLFVIYFFRSSYNFIKNELLIEGFSSLRRVLRDGTVLFKVRIQFSIVITVVASLLVVGLITVGYITDRYDTDQYKRLSQKIKATQAGFQEKNYASSNTQLKEDILLDINTFSKLFNTDISVYSLQGDLLISTQQKVFDLGLLSGKMNAQAYYNLHALSKTAFIGQERIGQLQYLAAYAPIRNADGKIIGYISLPYFTNQNEYRAEVSYFANALINVYALVFTIIAFLAFFVANAITSPLTIIQKTLSETKIGQVNQPIEWNRKDEIGSLVKEYNRMIRELEESLDKLAQSERESAWREMAKQVAHEIKNPLTPLKLGLQQLERSFKNEDADFNTKFERFAKTFIEQIDSLSQIATEFSNFAKMPEARTEPVNLLLELQKVIDLFKHNEKVHIQFRSENGINTWILADADQISRTFNNLIKNAIQAIPTDREGKIDISLRANATELIVQITDNGTGIPEEVQSKIFTPNFTTKNSGMGLGLAIIKNVLESIGGKIEFETKQNEGTTFFVYFPLYKAV